MRRARALRLLPLAGAALVGTAGCDASAQLAPQASTGATSARAALIANPAKDEWPERFLRAAPEVQATYRFALANKETLRYMPCYCGCVSDGHTSNYDCYVKEERPGGAYVLEPMSFG